VPMEPCVAKTTGEAWPLPVRSRWPNLSPKRDLDRVLCVRGADANTQSPGQTSTLRLCGSAFNPVSLPTQSSLLSLLLLKEAETPAAPYDPTRVALSVARVLRPRLGGVVRAKVRNVEVRRHRETHNPRLCGSAFDSVSLPTQRTLTKRHRRNHDSSIPSRRENTGIYWNFHLLSALSLGPFPFPRRTLQRKKSTFLSTK